ncbi:metal transporter [Devosia pacifica]|uniref:Metal transporter n=1 Tax=Devosia pacifica TaxID=1335967 RepID=A0A918RXV3_9HYPH|nr:potassium channel family protein [Devosia pacifica]GHA14996.1 metal transporter [Devosia pacifica]
MNGFIETGIAILISITLMSLSLILHYQAMILTRGWLQGSGLQRQAGTLIGMAVLTVAQLLSVGLYALAYHIAESAGWGSLAGEIEGTPLDQFYFSLMSYTTLGVGDIYPLGALRIISGIEALNGFALIGWTASFAYTLMRDGWER